MKPQLYVVGCLFVLVSTVALSIADMSWGALLPMLILLACPVAMVLLIRGMDGAGGGTGASRDDSRHHRTDWD